MSNSAFDKYIHDITTNPNQYHQLVRDLASSCVERDKKIIELEGVIAAMTTTLNHLGPTCTALMTRADISEQLLHKTEINLCEISGRSMRFEKALARFVVALRRQNVSVPPINELTVEDRELVWVHVKQLEMEAEQRV